MRRARHESLWVVSLVICGVFLASSARSQTSERTEWATYGNDPGGMRYSPLTQVDRHNVDKLKLVQLPAGGQTMPMTYQENGKQYVVISAGGHGKLGTTPGDSVMAFALP